MCLVTYKLGTNYESFQRLDVFVNLWSGKKMRICLKAGCHLRCLQCNLSMCYLQCVYLHSSHFNPSIKKMSKEIILIIKKKITKKLITYFKKRR